MGSPLSGGRQVPLPAGAGPQELSTCSPSASGAQTAVYPPPPCPAVPVLIKAFPRRVREQVLLAQGSEDSRRPPFF